MLLGRACAALCSVQGMAVEWRKVGSRYDQVHRTWYAVERRAAALRAHRRLVLDHEPNAHEGPGAGEPLMRTDDLFLGAFALSRGGELVGVEVQQTNGRRVAVFGIAGPGVEEAEREYFRGTTSVDIQHLKLQVRRLKERAFDAIRADERRAHAEEPLSVPAPCARRAPPDREHSRAALRRPRRAMRGCRSCGSPAAGWSPWASASVAPWPWRSSPNAWCSGPSGRRAEAWPAFPRT